MTLARKVLSTIYPVAGGATAGLTTKALLSAGRRFVVPGSRTPSDRGSGGTALVWTALSWAVSAGVGVCAGRKLVRKTVQPAQS